MGFLNWVKRGKPKSTPGKATPPTRRKGKMGLAGQAPPSWLADKWNKAKRVGGTAMTLGTGAAVGSMIPFAAGQATETDIGKMESYQPHRQS
jgi:hypothetical protein